MAIHTELDIYKAAYQLTGVATDLIKNMPRDVKRVIGDSLKDECLKLVTLIFKANVATNKRPYLLEIVERIQVAELLLRLSCDKKMISRAQYAKAAFLTTSISKQANGWRKSQVASPAT